ncbi:hypothetical protein P43SY_000529 [Pythium insidiosum]|uniref:Uncharacterized protein n=1 Tax=Pythium insidiosum TaxID=114742 RepID=A0AAD5Q5P1_PYTIN|nr:hypothetical protein P43SY_000529 [Pythium insidiosum]
MDRPASCALSTRRERYAWIPLGSSRDKGIVSQFEIDVAEGYGVLKAKAKAAMEADAQARLPDTHDVQIPNNTTFRQLQHIDLLQQEAVFNPESHADEFADVGVQINGTVVCLRLRVQDLRRALGLPAYPLCPPYREPIVAVPAPQHDMEDVDHLMSDSDEAEATA